MHPQEVVGMPVFGFNEGFLLGRVDNHETACSLVVKIKKIAFFNQK